MSMKMPNTGSECHLPAPSEEDDVTHTKISTTEKKAAAQCWQWRAVREPLESR